MVAFDMLIHTKIRVPVYHRKLISRDRLLDRLEAGLEKRITLLSAPAGCGKTSLLIDWISRFCSTKAFAWVSLDENDNDPNIFLRYVIAALQTTEKDLGRDILPLLQSHNPPPILSLLPSILNQINRRDERIVLILDDYHLISDQTIHQIMTKFIEMGTTGLHMVLATRADPPLPIYRYRAQGELSELRQNHLNFTLDETNDFLKDTHGKEFGQADVKLLHQRTEGWVVGLHLAGLSLEGSQDVSRKIADLSGNQIYIMEYLWNEVLDHQPEEIKDFLLKTSILKRLTGPLCDQLTGLRDGYATLEYLKNKNLFVSALDNEQVWYRYHHLFADLLKRQLVRAYGNILPRLHRAASEWYGHHGFLMEAIEHAIESQETSSVTAMVDQWAEKIWSQGQQIRLLGQLRQLPLEIVRSSIPLCTWYAMILFFYHGEQELVSELLQAAEALAKADPSSNPQYLKDIRGIQALRDAQVALNRRDMDSVIRHGYRTLEFLSPKWQMFRQIAQMILGDSLTYQGETVAGHVAYQELLCSEAIHQNSYLYYSIAFRSAISYFVRGQLQQGYDFALDHLNQLLKLQSALPGYEGAFRVALGQILVEWNRLDEAVNHFERACEIFEITSKGSADIFYHRMVRGYLARKQILRAQEIIGVLVDAVRESRLPQAFQSIVLARKMDLYINEGNISLAEEILKETAPVDFENLIYQDEEFHLALVRLWLLQRKYQRATLMLDALEFNVRKGNRICHLIRILVTRAANEALQNRSPVGMEYLAQALALAEPEGFVRAFIEGGPVIRDLLENLAAEAGGSDYIHRLLRAFDDLSYKQMPGEARVALIEALSEREQQVLRLLRTHLSQQEMADELCISVNTIRYHTKNIYRKLGVHDRSEAVSMAKIARLL